MPTASEFMDAADAFSVDIEKSRLVSKAELEVVRKDLRDQVRKDGVEAVKGLTTASVGGTRILVPNKENLDKIKLSSERTRKRFSDFRLNYLDRKQVEALKNEDALEKDPKKFIRHSRRLARHAKEFLKKIEVLDPQLEEEVAEALQQIEDNDMDLLKLEIKSFTQFKETLLRSVQGRVERGEAIKQFETYDINGSLWNLSLHEHPKAAVRGLLARSSEKAGSKVVEKISEIPKRTKVVVVPEPNAVSKANQKAKTRRAKGLPERGRTKLNPATFPEEEGSVGPTSRTAQIAWRLFSHKDLDDRFAKLNVARQGSPTSWRNLGLDFQTKDWYLHVPASIANEVGVLTRARRAAVLAALAGRGLPPPPVPAKPREELPEEIQGQ